MRVDAHVHVYEYDPLEHVWVTEELNALRGNYRPADLMPLMSAAGVDGCVAVEARQSVKENAYLLDLFDRYEQSRRWSAGWIFATPLSGMNWTNGRIVQGSWRCDTS